MQSFDDPLEAAPDAGLASLFYDGCRGYARLALSGIEGEWQAKNSVLVGDLQDAFARDAEELHRDSFLTVNTMLRPGVHQAKFVSDLNACFSDLDFYRGGLSTYQAKALVEVAIGKGVVLQPSLIVSSGQGLWLFWLLRDDAGKAPQGRTRAKATWSAIQQKIFETLEGEYPQLKPDLKACDLSRMTRIPGTTNSKTASRVLWHFTYENGRPLAYSLETLAAFHGVRPRGIIVKAPGGRGTHPNRVRGKIAMLNKRLAALDALVEMRGKMESGCRNYGLNVMAGTLAALKVPADQISERLERYAKRCDPPLRPSEMSKPLRRLDDEGKRLYSSERLARMLKVTPEEIAKLRAMGLAGSIGSREKKPPRSAKRRELLRRILATGASVSLRQIRAALAAEGINAALETIQRDMHAINLFFCERCQSWSAPAACLCAEKPN